MNIGNPIPRVIRDEIENLASEFEYLRQSESSRLSRYQTYRDEIEASRDAPQIPQPDDYGRKYARLDSPLQRHRLNLPFAQALTVKHSYRIAGRLPDVFVDRRDESIDELHRSSVMEKIVWGIMRECGGEQALASGAWEGSQIGAACYDLYFDIAKQMPMFREVDPSGVLVVRGLEDPHDFQRVYRFWQVPLRVARAEYRDSVFRDIANLSERMEKTSKVGSLEMVTLVQVADKERSIRFSLGGAVPLLEDVHDLGFVPYVVVPNLGPQRNIWGWADYEFVRDVCQYLPALFSREADIIRASAGGGYINKGTGQTTAAVKEILAKGGVLPSKADGSLEPIPSPDVPDFLPEHTAKAVEFLKMLGFAPDAAWGDGSAGSGSDRGLQLQPLLELTAMKQINWAAGLERLFSRAFRMIESKQVLVARYKGEVVTNGYRRSPFSLILDPTSSGQEQVDPMDPTAGAVLPQTPSELFDGDYAVRFVWQNRIDPEDPAFVMSELNKFQQGAQSLQTTLERLGVRSPEDEMKLIEKEAERFPWLRQGQIALIRAQLQAEGGGLQGEGGGAPVDPVASALDSFDMMNTKDGSALDTDAGISALPGETGVGIYSGGA